MKPTFFDKPSFEAHLTDKAKYIWCVFDRYKSPGFPGLPDPLNVTVKIFDLLYVKRVSMKTCEVTSIYKLAPYFNKVPENIVVETAYFYENSFKALDMTREEIQQFVMYLKLQGEVPRYPSVL